MPSKNLGSENQHTRKPSALIIPNNENIGNDLISPATQSGSVQPMPSFNGFFTTTNINSVVSPTGIPSSVKNAKAVLMDPSPQNKTDFAGTASSISEVVEEKIEDDAKKLNHKKSSKKHRGKQSISIFSFQLPGELPEVNTKKQVKKALYNNAAISNLEKVKPVKYFYNGDSLSFSEADAKLKALQKKDSSISSSVLAKNHFIKSSLQTDFQAPEMVEKDYPGCFLLGCFRRK